MPTDKKLLMVIPVNTDQYNDRAREYVAPVVAPGFTLDVVNIRKGFPAIQSRFSLDHNARHVVELVADIGPDYDGVFVSDFDGCGVEACREVLAIPVVDAFVPQASIALSLAETFSILTLNDTLVGLDISHPRMLGLTESLASVRPMDIRMTDLADLDRVVDHAFDASVAAITHDGAQAILLGCGALMGVAEPLAKRLVEARFPATVLDPNRASIAFLQALVRCGYSQSALCYPTPPELRDEARARGQLKPAPRPRGSGVLGA